MVTFGSSSFSPGSSASILPYQTVPARRVAYFDRYARHSRSAPRVSGSASTFSIFKRIFDFSIAAAGLLFLLPLLIGIAIAIKATSRGPIFFRQYRYGYRSRIFSIYKFRTMYVGVADKSGRQQTVQGDSRITRVGRVLRNTSLDEIPQLINVLKGDMSLVGPRPHVPGMIAAGVLYEDLVPYYFQRHATRPGITGLAQVNGWRGSTQDAEAAISRVDQDLDYIARRSLLLDISIVVRTVRREFIGGSGM